MQNVSFLLSVAHTETPAGENITNLCGPTCYRKQIRLTESIPGWYTRYLELLAKGLFATYGLYSIDLLTGGEGAGITGEERGGIPMNWM
ncbi:MAG: hypothetical protein C0399_11975 [Syntrophus sp. (in: bacteria)]|nr:hypothetical protein [Syntrophus sp. (in: bacteria)]